MLRYLPATNEPLHGPLFPNPFEIRPISGFFSNALYKTIADETHCAKFDDSLWCKKRCFMVCIYRIMYFTYFYRVSLIILAVRFFVYVLLLCIVYYCFDFSANFNGCLWGSGLSRANTSKRLNRRSLRKNVFSSRCLAKILLLCIELLFYLRLLSAFR